MSTALSAAWERGQRGWPERYPLLQIPNAPLLVFIAASVARRLGDGDTAAAFDAIARVGLSVWAYEELTSGVNGFRRGLGAVVLAVTVAGLAEDLR